MSLQYRGSSVRAGGVRLTPCRSGDPNSITGRRNGAIPFSSYARTVNRDQVYTRFLQNVPGGNLSPYRKGFSFEVVRKWTKCTKTLQNGS